jgi:hypothetical protein
LIKEFKELETTQFKRNFLATCDDI